MPPATADLMPVSDPRLRHAREELANALTHGLGAAAALAAGAVL